MLRFSLCIVPSNIFISSPFLAHPCLVMQTACKFDTLLVSLFPLVLVCCQYWGACLNPVKSFALGPFAPFDEARDLRRSVVVQ